MMKKPDETAIALGKANRDSDASIFSAAARRPWTTPQVILGTMEEAELGVGLGSDGGTPFNEAS